MIATGASEKSWLLVASNTIKQLELSFSCAPPHTQVLKQQELLYHADFQIQMLERKVARAGGERSDEEKRLLNAKIDKLSQELEEVNSEHAMLTQQVKKAEDDLVRARRRQQDFKKEQEVRCRCRRRR